MSYSLWKEFKLAGPEGDGVHPYVSKDGAFIGRGVSLLERDPGGCWRPRSRAALEKLFRAGYLATLELDQQLQSLGAVARALDKGDLSLAAIALVHARLPALPDEGACWRLAKADGLAQDYDADQPRRPAGEAGGGQWTSGGGGASASSKPDILAPLSTAAASLAGEAVRATPSLIESISSGALAILRGITAASVAGSALRAGGPITAFGGTLVLFPPSTESGGSGTLPDDPSIRYSFDDKLLVLNQSGTDGADRILYTGLPDANGIYRTADGAVVGRKVGDKLLLDGATRILESTRATALDVVPSEQARADASTSTVEDNRPKVCPDPSLDVPHGASARAWAYQMQITGLPKYMAVWLNGRAFDGCLISTGDVQETKGKGYAKFLQSDGNWKPFFKGGPKADQQMIDQSRAAASAGHMVRWYAAEETVAEHFRRFAERNHLDNVMVIYEPARE